MKAVAFRLLPTLVVLLVLEAGMRLFGLPRFDACWQFSLAGRDPALRALYGSYWLLDPELGWRFKPDSTVELATINEQGFRGPVLSPERRPGSTRLLFIGDSTCFGLGVSLRETFAARSTQLIARDHPGSEFEYALGAVPGYSSYHSRVLLERLLPLQPDLVVFYVGAYNDHTPRPFYPDADTAGRMARLTSLWHRVRVLRAAESLIDLARHRLASDHTLRVPPESFRANVEAMLASAADAGAASLVLVPPYSHDLLRRHPAVPRYLEILESVAGASGVASVALQPEFERHLEQSVYHDDRYHFSALGHRITAAAIRRAVAEAGLVGKGRR